MGIRIAVYEGTRSLRMLRKEQLSGFAGGRNAYLYFYFIKGFFCGKQELTQRCPVVPDLSRKAPFVRAAALNLFPWNDMKDSRASAPEDSSIQSPRCGSISSSMVSLYQIRSRHPFAGKRSASPDHPPATAVLDRGSRPRSGLNPAATLRDTL